MRGARLPMPRSRHRCVTPGRSCCVMHTVRSTDRVYPWRIGASGSCPVVSKYWGNTWTMPADDRCCAPWSALVWWWRAHAPMAWSCCVMPGVGKRSHFRLPLRSGAPSRGPSIRAPSSPALPETSAMSSPEWTWGSRAICRRRPCVQFERADRWTHAGDARIVGVPRLPRWHDVITDRLALAGYIGALENGADFGDLGGERGVTRDDGRRAGSDGHSLLLSDSSTCSDGCRYNTSSRWRNPPTIVSWWP